MPSKKKEIVKQLEQQIGNLAQGKPEALPDGTFAQLEITCIVPTPDNMRSWPWAP